MVDIHSVHVDVYIYICYDVHSVLVYVLMYTVFSMFEVHRS